MLLCSVFGPYARDDRLGSRRLDPMELYENQVTRQQGPFSLRMFHRSWGLMLLQCNVDAPCTLLDFPTLDRFIAELRATRYDIVGIGSIIPNLAKVELMCRLVRRHQPWAKVLIGGHIAAFPDALRRLDVDHVVPGEGVAWMRAYLGQRPDAPLRHPVVPSALAPRALGFSMGEGPHDVAAVLLPSVGCAQRCDFCCTSALFEGQALQLYPSGDELFQVMLGLQRRLGARSFFVMDENFLLQRDQCLRLADLMEQHGRAWSLYVFSSARAVAAYSDEELLRLGVSWLWLGLEGEDASYPKLAGVDTRALVRRLQHNGICVLGSSIIGLPEHSPETMPSVIAHAVSHRSEFHQFMLYTPGPGTPLWRRMEREGRLLDRRGYDDADIHGQLSFNYRHWHLPPGTEGEWLRRAFDEDLAVNGPSVLRVGRTRLQGLRVHGEHPDPRVRRRIQMEGEGLATAQAGALWAAARWYADQPGLRSEVETWLDEVVRHFGWRARAAAPLLGRIVLAGLRREDRRRRLRAGVEPPTVLEANPRALTAQARARGARPARWVAPILP